MTEPKEVEKQILYTYNEIIPSTDMSIEEYDVFLNCATVKELEYDIVSQETYYKICKELGKPISKPYPPRFRCMW